MGKKLIDEFIEYAKKEYGLEFYTEKSDQPDTFESIFGISFIEQYKDEIEEYNDSIEVEYMNSDISFGNADSQVYCMTDSFGFAA